MYLWRSGWVHLYLKFGKSFGSQTRNIDSCACPSFNTINYTNHIHTHLRGRED